MDIIFLAQIIIPLTLVAFLLLSVEMGYRLGARRVRGSDAGKAMETGAIQGAMLGLLGLLLGFSFAGASGRYMERQDLISQEANVIGTTYLRADLLDDPHSTALKNELIAYVDHRVEASQSLQRGMTNDTAQIVEDAHRQIWATTLAGVQAKPHVLVAVVAPVNELIDLHDSRIAAARKHLPGLVLGLLITCSALTLGVIGYACALARRRNTIMTSVIAILIGAALWTTIDLDRARIGLIRVTDVALSDLQKQLQRWSEREAN